MTTAHECSILNLSFHYPHNEWNECDKKHLFHNIFSIIAIITKVVLTLDTFGARILFQIMSAVSSSVDSCVSVDRCRLSGDECWSTASFNMKSVVRWICNKCCSS